MKKKEKEQKEKGQTFKRRLKEKKTITYLTWCFHVSVPKEQCAQ